MEFERTYSHAPWETKIGYCRALRAGDLIFVTGTAPVAEDGSVFAPGAPYPQARHCLELIERALRNLGSDRTAIVRTRMFVTDIDRWPEIGRAHGAVFGTIRPVATMVQVARLIDPEHLVEIEVDAVVTE